MNESLRSLEGFKEIKDTFYKLHPMAQDDGGLGMVDSENKIPQALKDLMSKIAERTMKGQLSTLISIPMPAYIHLDMTHLNLQQNDCMFSNFLTQAASMQDPVERMKKLVAFCVAGLFVNPTIT